ncbi:homeobox protein Hox-B3a-like [Vanessa cardui]|uniref:homeobox protein Hox-B3a-like n=1 Tax=Vanessa cardui TaxID=171605 RepID=UPI001F138BC4|nr:homeobox protein Hox-B3a-like [Vanessa cardui]
MFQNVLMTALTPLCDTNEVQQWENQPFANKWPEPKYSKESSVTKTIKKKNKRNRTAYTTEQLRVLEKTFCRSKYIDAERRKELSQCLMIGEKCIKVWFQNRRMKEKKESSESSCDSSSECFAIEPVSPPPDNVIIPNNTGQYVPNNNNQKGTIPTTATERECYFNPYEGNITTEALYAGYYQNYDAVSYTNYNTAFQTGEYFRNDSSVYPTQYYPATNTEYTNLDDQAHHRNDNSMYNWVTNGFDLNYF